MTDIECLLEADIGIVMTSTGAGNLMETLGRYNISVQHVSFWEPQKGNSLWFARDFQDIINCKLFAGLATTPVHRYGESDYRERWVRESQARGF